MVDPIARFAETMARAAQNAPFDPIAMALATSTADGRPSCRIILVHQVDERGVVFHTNYSGRKATEIDPEGAAYWNSLGMTLGGNDRFSEAETAFRRAVDLEKENARYAFNLGLILMRQNRPADARPFFQKAVEIEPRFEEARRYLREIDGM